MRNDSPPDDAAGLAAVAAFIARWDHSGAAADIAKGFTRAGVSKWKNC